MTTVKNLGIDVGALFVKIAVFDRQSLTKTIYRAHQGNPNITLNEILAGLDDGDYRVGLTGSGVDLFAKSIGIRPMHFIEAEIKAVRDKFPKARNILNVGGGSCTIIHLDEKGKFLNYSGNSLCAAGTGSFLDEQARRLELDYDAIAGFEYDGVPPSIASRCAVFAKSDLIHRQQEGYSKQAMWAGLCKGCVDTFLQTLLKGKPLEGQSIVTGGVAQNKLIIKRLSQYLGKNIKTWKNAHVAGAIGAAKLAALENVFSLSQLVGKKTSGSEKVEEKTKTGTPLLLKRTRYPSFEVDHEYMDQMQNEVRIWDKLSGDIPVTLGIDIGSTSTKLVLLDMGDKVLVDIYRKTLGDPLGAVKKLFQAVEKIMEDYRVNFIVKGCGTTGSGRKFVGRVIGADSIINEISAHVAGAMFTDPQIDTIFEIGGQDSKYMHTVNGAIRDANMNFICAAGTGSFVEEQANKLGFSVGEIGEKVMGIAPPETSDRCTVFMEEDTNKLLRQGFMPVDAIAAVMNSVVKNYLNKVVGNRYVSKEKVFFQGATARNKGLVAAFENLLGVEVVVSPLCHQMGSFGVALLTAKEGQSRTTESSFRGFDLYKKDIELTKEECEACNNSCRITFAHIAGEDERPSWGYMCGKDPDDAKPRANKGFSLFRKRDRFLHKIYKNQPVEKTAPVMGIPFSLSIYSYLPFWTAMLNTLGWKVELSPVTNDRIKERGTQNSSGDFCFPVKVAIGHALEMMDKKDYQKILIPQTISNIPNEFTTNSLFCPYLQSHAGVMKSIFTLQKTDQSRLVTPIFDLRWDAARMAKELAGSIGASLNVKKSLLKKAIGAAFTAQKEFENSCHEAGKAALLKLKENGEKGIVMVGRPYNCFDKGANLGLPEKIAEYGYTVIPIDFVPFDPKSLGDEYRNIYWNYGQRIISAMKTVAKNENLFAVYLSNFNCGPDSFLLTYAEQIMGARPLLILELDEHGADAGYMTRVEAFLDVVSKNVDSKPGIPPAYRTATDSELEGRTLWIPPMHPYTGEIATGIFKRYGITARALPPEDREAYEIGRAVVRGSECLPTSVTIGGLLKTLRDMDAKGNEHALFMPTATGPCRFGQYAYLHRSILDRCGYKDLAIVSPSSYNSYQGLSEKLRRELWHGFLAGDVLYKMVTKIRPYEKNPGETDALAKEEAARLRDAFYKNKGMEIPLRKAADRFAAIDTYDLKKPLVGVVGEIYVRCNEFSNGYVIDNIEQYGGEAWLAPISEWILYTAYLQDWSAKQQMRNITARGKSLLKNTFLHSGERKYYQWCEKVLHDRHEPSMDDVIKDGEKYLPINFEGEAIITIGRATQFIKQGAELVVNCAPFGCMPGNLTASIFQQIEQEKGVPLVSMYYDGEGEINKRLEVYLHQSQKGKKELKANKENIKGLGYTG